MFPSSFYVAAGQSRTGTLNEPCATVQRLKSRPEHDPLLRERFLKQRRSFNSFLAETVAKGSVASRVSTVFIPVVFHIVIQYPASVTDAQTTVQPDTLNKDLSGSNGDPVKIASCFKPLFGKSAIQFCLAQRTPDGDPATGIVRITTLRPRFNCDDTVKHSSSGGGSRDTNNYFNVWVGDIGNPTCLTFPNNGSPAEQGAVPDYRFLPRGGDPSRNEGKALSHETGHYFNLHHIRATGGNGTDYADDTLNQTGPTPAGRASATIDNFNYRPAGKTIYGCRR